MLPAGFNNRDKGTDEVKSTKHARTGANHAILTKWIKHQLEVKLLLNLLRFSFCKKNFFMGRRSIIETITCALFWSISNKYIDEI